VITLDKLPYREHLISLNLHALKYRRLHGNMIEVFEIVNEIYDGKVTPILHNNNTSVTRGNKFKLHSQTFTISENIFSRHVL